MRIVNIHEAKTHFLKLIDAVIHGNEILIAIAGKSVTKLVPISKKPERKFGTYKGKIKIAKDFDAPLPCDFLFLPPQLLNPVSQTLGSKSDQERQR